MNAIVDNSIIALDRFIQSTRDSGYKSTASAISELVDNAVQAGASHISIVLEQVDGAGSGIRLAVIDDGSGMDGHILTQALRFGGSSRYNDRSGLGRFGMGLPNASMSQARRVSVYSWQHGVATPLMTYLDVDEIASGNMSLVPSPVVDPVPDWVGHPASTSGTVVVWERCDRLDHRRISTIEKKLHTALGRVFRYVILGGIVIDINGQPVRPIDPLFLDDRSELHGASVFEDIWEAEFFADPDDPDSPTGTVQVIFSELPVHAWHALPNEKKRGMGISNNAGVSVVRGRREVDFGWFFMGTKRRENYDDWWRCEVRFDPVLDEAFGITHTKQQIRPKEHLLEALQPYIESMAKILNGRVRQAHTDVKVGLNASKAEQLAESRDKKLRPLPAQTEERRVRQTYELENLAKRHDSVARAIDPDRPNGIRYHIIEDDLGEACFFKPLVSDGAVVGVVNPRHRFYRTLYRPIIESKDVNSVELGNALQLVLLAAARAEAAFSDSRELEIVERFRQEWSQAMDVLLSAR